MTKRQFPIRWRLALTTHDYTGNLWGGFRTIKHALSTWRSYVGRLGLHALHVI